MGGTESAGCVAMKLRRLPLLLAALCLPGWAAEEARLPKQDLTAQMFYQFLLAEIAGQRGQLGLASEAYGTLAKTTQDPRVARRAAEVAFFARRYDTALDAARLWSQLDPESTEARYLITALLVVLNRQDDLLAHLPTQLAAEGANLGAALMQINRQLARMQDRQAAWRIIDKVTAPYPNIAEAHFARAQAAQAAGENGLALAEIDRALAIKPDWEYAALVRVQLVSPSSEAVAWLGRFVASRPQALEARLAYARLLVGERRYQEARQEFAGLLDANPDNTDVIYAVAVLSMQLNDLVEAEKQLKRLLALGYPDANTVRIYLGQIAEDGKRPEDAIAWYSQATADGQKYLAARLRAAAVMAHEGKLDDALAFIRQTSAGSPEERAQIRVGEAQLLRDAGRDRDAFAVLERALADQPDQPDLLYETALSAEKLGKTEILELHLRRLIAIKPDYAHAYNALGYSLADRNVRLDEAAQLIDKALQLAPDDPFILDSKGWVQYRQGNFATALESLQKAFSIKADPEIAAHLGEVLWTLGRKDEARKTWGDATKASPANPVLADTIKKFIP